MKTITHNCPNCGAPNYRLGEECEYCNTISELILDSDTVRVEFQLWKDPKMKAIDVGGLDKYIQNEVVRAKWRP